jgi:hypothetical protein
LALAALLSRFNDKGFGFVELTYEKSLVPGTVGVTSRARQTPREAKCQGAVTKRTKSTGLSPATLSFTLLGEDSP